MSLFDAIWLAVIQALTEFLPVSSSGHLRLFREFFVADLKVDLRYDLFLHIGTLLAVMIYYRRRLASLLGSFFYGLLGLRQPGFWQSPASEGVRYASLLILATLPTVALGLLFRKWVSSDAISIQTIGLLLVVNAAVLVMAHQSAKRYEAKATLVVGGPNDAALANERGGIESIRSLRPWQALAIGTAQGFAVFPGISRSGSTIAAALMCGQSRERAVEFSFFLSIIAVAGAILLEVVGAEASSDAIPAAAWVAGFVITLFGGLAALAALRLIVKKGGLQYFALYCTVVGIFTMIVGRA